jgi:hypothetical protein
MNVGLKLPRALRMLLLGALLLQAIVVQTHVHFARLAASAQVSAGRTSAGSGAAWHERLSSADNCPLCWEVAMAGHYSLPPPAAVLSTSLILFWLALPAAIVFSLAPPPRGWLSRAPPR